MKSDESTTRKHLKDENNVVGRAHGCEEVHEQGIENWIERHPEHHEHWHKIKANMKDRS